MKTHKHTLHKRCTATIERFARCAAALLLVFSMLLAVLPVFAQGESVLADSDIPEALSRAQLEEHGAVQRLYDEEQGDYVMWADRAYDSYCHGDQHTEFNAIAVVYNSWPVINFLTLDPNEANDAQKRKAKMSIVLTHEMAHVLGLPDVYDDEAHTGVECVMNTYSTESGVSFYKRIMDGKADYFCQSCTEKLNILTAKVLMEGNE